MAIEYKIPLTSKRVDFILSGLDEAHNETAVIVELKQWTTVEATPKDAIVETFVGGGKAGAAAPFVPGLDLRLPDPGLQRDRPAGADQPATLRLPAQLRQRRGHQRPALPPAHRAGAGFLKADAEKLQAFLSRYIRYGDRSQILYRIDNGKLKPSKNLADHLLSLLQGNKEFHWSTTRNSCSRKRWNWPTRPASAASRC